MVWSPQGIHEGPQDFEIFSISSSTVLLGRKGEIEQNKSTTRLPKFCVGEMGWNSPWLEMG